MFPEVYDTKHIFLVAKKDFPELRTLFDLTSLAQLFAAVQCEQFNLSFQYQPQVTMAIDSNVDGDDANGAVGTMHIKPHDAGFDSYATGVGNYN